MTTIRKKLTIVGDGGCGKTCLLIVFSKDEFPANYIPTVFDNFVSDIEVNGKRVCTLYSQSHLIQVHKMYFLEIMSRQFSVSLSSSKLNICVSFY